MTPSPTARRLLKETAELSTSAPKPAPAFHAQPVSEADLHEWHFTLLGPPSPSPYAGGLYHGRITLPPQYPLKPPNFRFLTPSGRFEVNREICLSISGFHEETWMPAWGIRTALTALRTFMAEQGTAGQVGGLEASVEVRRRMAEQSRDWRCEACRGRSNQEIMTEWWQSCRQRGVNIDEEGVDLGLEWLPDSLRLEARDPAKPVQPPYPADRSGRGSQEDTLHGQTQTLTPTPAVTVTHTADAFEAMNSVTPVAAQTHSIMPQSSTPTPEQIQSRAEAVLTRSEQASSPDQRRILNPHASVMTASMRTLEHQVPRQQREQQPMLTIDRAIAGVFVALVVMLLKKVFYPARSPGPDYVDRGGAYYLEREF
ncbi:hypothetical protein DV738_g4319, partial [Chaetothyriales sp. CBS 135597]